MTTKQQLSAAQWDIVKHAPLAIWLGVSGVDPVVDSLEDEYAAFHAAAKDLGARYSSNELVTALVAELVPPSEAQRKGRASVDVNELLATLKKTSDVLKAVATPAEAAGCKEFLLRFGDRIARASSESVMDSRFTVSQAEDEFLSKVRVALGL